MEYYEALGVEKSADSSSIKKAYRKLAMKYHPDKNPGNKQAEEKFKLINEAYSVLSNSEKKATYDQYGKAGLNPRGEPGYTNPHDIFNDFFKGFGGGFGDIFNNNQKRSQKGSNIHTWINVDIDVLIFGGSADVSIPIKHICSSCSGTGSDGPPQTCPDCNGRGQVSFMRGFMQLTTTCGRCHGSGKIIVNPCSACNATGTIKEQKNISIEIPSGVRPGQTIRVPNGGNDDGGGLTGDLLVDINCDNQDFEIYGNDLVKKIDIDCFSACAGCELNISTLDGKKIVKAPAGIQHGNSLKLQGLGFPTSVGAKNRGDLLLLINIVIPTNLTSHQVDLLNRIRGTHV